MNKKHQLEQFGREVRKARKKKGWTQTKLGMMLGGYKKVTISAIENGRLEPPGFTMVNLIRLLELDLVSLVEMK